MAEPLEVRITHWLRHVEEPGVRRLLGSGYTIDAHAVGMLDDVLASARQIRQAVRGPMLGLGAKDG